MKSEFLKLNWRDLVNGFAMSVITPAIMVIYDSLNAGSLVINWTLALTVGLAGGVGYLLKNLLQGDAPTQRSTDFIGNRPNDRGGKKG